MVRSLGLVIAVVLVSVSSFAQDITSVSLDRRQREGTAVSGSFTVPSDASLFVLDFTPDVGQADQANLTQSAVFRIMAFRDGQFQLVSRARWRGGNPMIAIRVWEMSGLQGRDVRFEIDTPARIAAGGTLQLSVRPPEPPN